MDRQKNIVRTLNLLQWNAQSLRPKLKEFELKIHIAFISETWLQAESVLNVNSFNIFRKDRHDSNGGVAIIVHRSIIIVQEYHGNTSNNSIEIISLKLLNCSDIKNVVSIYCSSSVRTVVSDWENIFSAFTSKSIIVGDFNAHHSCWSNRSDTRGTQIYDIALDTGFMTLNNGEYTRIRLVNSYLQKSSPDITFISSNIAKYKDYIKDQFRNLENEENPQVFYDSLINLINKAANVSIPMIKVPQNPTGKFIPRSYWSPSLSHKVAQRRLAHREFRRNPIPNSLNVLEKKHSEARSAIYKARAQDWLEFCDSIDGATTS
ncbi:unnamed protein product [Leptidea sinapis]|uniref:Endonuclease/exonuclease/phosphatase domain-containing protein n=1 Tax=Leptidea sinapis TaxID=189913 RepID=A0A5E4R8U8_9NEOP|nr:unnamed protein product [Leptidea sinapis]